MSETASHDTTNQRPAVPATRQPAVPHPSRAGHGPAHGYAIGKDVETRSGGALDPTTGALYQALKRLTDDGLVEQLRSAPDPETDARRKYFRLTALGRRVAAAEAERLAGLVAAARERNLYPAST